MRRRVAALSLMGVVLLGSRCFAAQWTASPTSQTGVYSTWDGPLEIDKCASAWLIKRFVDKQAVIKLYPRKTLKMQGQTFDVPMATLKRLPQMSCFESLVRHFEITEPVVLDIALIVRDIEVNVWAKKRTAESPGVAAIFSGLDPLFEDKMKGLEHSFVVLDALYKHIEARRGTGAK